MDNKFSGELNKSINSFLNDFLTKDIDTNMAEDSSGTAQTMVDSVHENNLIPQTESKDNESESNKEIVVPTEADILQTTSNIASELHVVPQTIRNYAKAFPEYFSNEKGRRNARVFNSQDVEIFREINHLVYDRRMSQSDIKIYLEKKYKNIDTDNALTNKNLLNSTEAISPVPKLNNPQQIQEIIRSSFDQSLKEYLKDPLMQIGNKINTINQNISNIYKSVKTAENDSDKKQIEKYEKELDEYKQILEQTQKSISDLGIKIDNNDAKHLEAINSISSSSESKQKDNDIKLINDIKTQIGNANKNIQNIRTEIQNSLNNQKTFTDTDKLLEVIRKDSINREKILLEDIKKLLDSDKTGDNTSKTNNELVSLKEKYSQALNAITKMQQILSAKEETIKVLEEELRNKEEIIKSKDEKIKIAKSYIENMSKK